MRERQNISAPIIINYLNLLFRQFHILWWTQMESGKYLSQYSNIILNNILCPDISNTFSHIRIRVVVMGDNKVGKTAILQRFLYNSFKVGTFLIHWKAFHSVSIAISFIFFPIWKYEKYISVLFPCWNRLVMWLGQAIVSRLPVSLTKKYIHSNLFIYIIQCS